MRGQKDSQDGEYIRHYTWMNAIKGGAARDVFAALYQLAGGDSSKAAGSCCVSVAYLCERCGWDERTVQRTLQALEGEGLLGIERRTGRRAIYTPDPRQIITPVRLSPPSDCHPRQIVTPPPSSCHPPIYKELEQNVEQNRESGAKAPPRTQKPAAKKNTSKFKPPTLAEVEAYVEEQGLQMSAASFFDYFTSNGWKVGGRAAMKNWRAAVRNWARREHEFNKQQTTHTHYEQPKTFEERLADGSLYNAIRAGLDME